MNIFKRTTTPHSFFILSYVAYLFFLYYIFGPFNKINSEPFFQVDYGFHYFNGINISSYISENFRAWAYNPFFSGGIREGLNFSSNIIVLLNLILCMLPNPLRYNVAVLLIFILLPLLLLTGVAKFFKIKDIPLYSATLFILFMIGTSMGREFIYCGHFSFLLAVVFSIWGNGLLLKYIETKRKLCLWQHALIFSLSIFTNFLSGLIFAAFYLSLGIIYRKKISAQMIGALILAVIIIGIVPNGWAIPMLLKMISLQQRGVMAQYLQAHGLAQFNDAFLLFLYLGFVAATILFIKRHQLRYHKTTSLFFLTSLIFFAVANWGSFLRLHNLQPARFIIPFCITATCFTGFVLRKWTAYAIVILALISFAQFADEPFNVHGSYHDVRNFTAAIAQKVSKKARIYIQDSWGLPYYTTRIMYAIPPATRIPIMNRPFTYPLIFTQFVDDIIFKQSIELISENALLKYFDYYNVGYVIAFSSIAKNRFEHMPSFKKVLDYDNFAMFENRANQESYCHGCNAQVDFDINQIRVTNAIDNEIILKFHFMENIKMISDSPVNIYPVHVVKEDMLPFIGVRTNGVKNFVIYVK